MGQVYNTQSFISIKAEYTKNISASIASGVIKYVDPDGVEGQWPATHDAANKRFVYEFPVGTTLKKGKWKAWSFAIMTDGRTLPGEPDTFTVRAEGT